MGDIVDEHYGSADVAGEIAWFSQGRWASVYVEVRMKRYYNHGFLQIDSVEDFEKPVVVVPLHSPFYVYGGPPALRKPCYLPGNIRATIVFVNDVTHV